MLAEINQFPQRHLVDRRSDEGSSGCRNVNKNNYKRLYFAKFVITYEFTFQPMSLFKDDQKKLA